MLKCKWCGKKVNPFKDFISLRGILFFVKHRVCETCQVSEVFGPRP